MAGICYNCFHNLEMHNQSCPFCGFGINSYEATTRALAPGTLLDNKYIVGISLGEGGFGITYLAWDKNMKTKVAIKEYFPGTLVTRDAAVYGGNTLHTLSQGGHNDFETGLKRYVEEAAILAKFFNLPGIVTVKDFFYGNGTAYIVMEYIDGISLKEFLKSNGGKLSTEETLRIMEPIISSLAIVHGNKLLHRDISPDNIMLGRDGSVKLIDFGAARYFDGEYEKSMTVVLKHGYAPIEQYSRKGEQGAWTDIYALCAVIYRMLTGIVPEEAVGRVGNDGLKPIRQLDKKIPKYIAEAVEKGLALYPEGRQRNMQELHDDLYITKEGIRSRYSNKAYKIVWKCLVILIIFLIIITGGSVLYLMNREKIDGFKEKVESVFTGDIEQEESIKGNDEEERKDKRIEENDIEPEMVQKNEQKEETEASVGIKFDKTSKIPENQNVMTELSPVNESVQEIDSAEEVQDDNVLDPDVEYAVIVARDGTLNGRNQSFTVGDILDMYSDSKGMWTGYKDQNNQIYIYYQGMKNGESFAVEFTVYTNDTFKITGAAKNGVKIERYSDFFQEILDEIGI